MVEKIKSLKNIITEILNKFKMRMPHMHLYVGCHFFDEIFLIQEMRSLPVLEAKVDEGLNCVELLMNWHGSNFDVFKSKENKESEQTDEAWANIKTGKGYVKTVTGNDGKKKFVKSKGNPWQIKNNNIEKTYPSRFSLQLYSLSRVNVYDWGFEILTNTPMYVIGVYHKNNIVSGLTQIGQKLSFEVLQVNTDSLMMYWLYNSAFEDDADDFDDYIFDDNSQRKVPRKIDVGIKANHHMDVSE